MILAYIYHISTDIPDRRAAKPLNLQVFASNALLNRVSDSTGSAGLSSHRRTLN